VWVGGFPEGHASSRWLIDIRIDRFQRTTIMIVAMASPRLHGPKAIRWPNLRG
jgi:hypothetical protein